MFFRFLSLVVVVIFSACSSAQAPAGSDSVAPRERSTDERFQPSESAATTDQQELAPVAPEVDATNVTPAQQSECQGVCNQQMSKCGNSCRQHRDSGSGINYEAGCARKCREDLKDCTASCRETGEPIKFARDRSIPATAE